MVGVTVPASALRSEPEPLSNDVIAVGAVDEPPPTLEIAVPESPRTPTIALIAHDHRKPALIEWATYNRDLLVRHDLVATGTTGKLLADALDHPVTCLNSGPLGGDQEMGALIAQGRIQLVIFFWDPLAPMPHDPDVKALLRLAVVWNVPMACNRSTADFLISSPLFLDPAYQSERPDYSAYTNRFEGDPAD